MRVIILFLIMSFIFPNSTIDTIWIDNSISKMGWTGYKVTGSHNGQIKIKNGYVLKSEDLITGGEIIIDMQSISVDDIKNPDKNQYLVSHLKNEDFFDVEKFPTANLKILSSKQSITTDKTNSNIEISAELTIKNITHKILFYSYVDFNKNTSKGQLIIDRTKWNIKYGSNSFYNLGDRAIYDDFLLDFELSSKQ